MRNDIWKILRKKYSWRFLAFCFLSAAGSLLMVAGPRLLGTVTTEIFDGIIGKLNGTGGMRLDVIASTITVILILYLIAFLCVLSARIGLESVLGKVTSELREAVNNKLHTVTLKELENRKQGELFSLVMNDVDTAGRQLGKSIENLISQIVFIIAILIMLFLIHPLMALFAFCIMVLSAVNLIALSSNAKRKLQKKQTVFAEVSGQVEELFAAKTKIRVYGQEKKISQRFLEMNRQILQTSVKADFWSDLAVSFTDLTANVGYVVVVFAGGAFAVSGGMKIGDIQAFLHYMRNLSQPLQQIARARNEFMKATVSMKQIEDFLQLSEEPTGEISVGSGEAGSVIFDNVAFGYSGDEFVLRDFSLRVSPGQKVALVGQTGVGKSTLMKLLLRFYDTKEGKVYVDGIDVREYSLEALRQKFAAVLQDTWLFEGTIYDNILYGTDNVSEEEVYRAAKLAGADSYIRSLPKGYQTMLKADGRGLSDGQRQQIAIARAFLKNPEILILDEATSQIDEKTENQIQQSISSLMKDRTSFLIAHRLSTVRDADLILVLDQGHIAEQGTHTELLLKKGIYASMVLQAQ